ncbi:MAG: peptide chain release factor 1 [Deltaproteobacteria bacterium]|nr:MAG: peptide chain release factor 1 [Deltaproteobacteria bacterium]
MFDKLDEVEKRFADIETQISDPEVIADRTRYAALMREHAELSDVVATYRRRKELARELEEARGLREDPDPEIREMAAVEERRLEQALEEVDADLKRLLVPKDPLDKRNAMLEIRAGTGGAEAALFAADLLRMYKRYCERSGRKVETLYLSPATIGGVKEAVLLVSGRDAYGRLKHEGGVHRVQRVPETEAQGRIHTSAVTVAVLPEAEDVDVKIDDKDLRIDVYRSSGPGGQSVNTTDSAVRITHIPTGLVVTCQDEKSQHKNKAQAMKILRSRLFELEEAKRRAEIDADRRSMVGTGDRSERIRTYNFPQGRVTDHRIGLTLYSLEDFLDGDLDEVLDALVAHFQAQALQGSAP